MTTEEKAKAYDNALERARLLKLANPDDEAIQTFVKDSFPELRDSEDERIRKALITLTKVPRKEIFEAEGITKEQALAWLERQKEQKPAEWSEDIIRKGIKEVGLTQYQINWLKNNVFPPKEEQKPVDLEKATEEYIEKRAGLAPYKRWDIEDIRDAARFGAKWMKEQTPKTIEL